MAPKSIKKWHFAINFHISGSIKSDKLFKILYTLGYYTNKVNNFCTQFTDIY